MTHRLCTRFAAFVLVLVIAACSGSKSSSSDSASPSPTAPSPAPAPTPIPQPAPPPSPAPSGCTPTLTGLPSSVNGSSGRYQFSVNISSTCDWTARTDVGWADVSPGSGRGSASPTLNVSTNEGFVNRTATVTVNGQTVSVVQTVGNCSFDVNPTTLDESSDGGIARVTVAASDSRCTWTATASESWIRVRTPSGTGSGIAEFDIAANAGDVRHAYITLAGRRVDVIQRRRG